AMSTTLLAFATPTRLTKSRTASAGTPRRRSPASVGMRGSSQPPTCPPRTSSVSTRLDNTVWGRLRRGDSDSSGGGETGGWPRRRRNREMLDEPVVQGPMVLEFERAEGMGDVLDGVGLAVGKVIAWINAPGRARARMARVQNAIEHRVAQIDVAGCHVDLGS